MVETRMDAIISRAASQASQASQARTMGPRPAGERPLRPQTEQVLEARPVKNTQSVKNTQPVKDAQPVKNTQSVKDARPVKDAKAIETDIARIFAKRAFQATMVNENRTAAPKEGPRGGRLDIRA